MPRLFVLSLFSVWDSHLSPLRSWECITLPPNCKPVNCKWIFKIKYNVDGSMAKCKTHLAANGFTQVESIDLNETFSHVA